MAVGDVLNRSLLKFYDLFNTGENTLDLANFGVLIKEFGGPELLIIEFINREIPNVEKAARSGMVGANHILEQYRTVQALLVKE